MFRIVALILFSLICMPLQAQYPPYFNYNSESGLPSEEIYCIAEDPKGFVWIGCDEGLFRFNGVKYLPFRSPEQKSRPITGVSFSKSGRLYCYNFKWQIFYMENDSLIELKAGFEYVSYITTDSKTSGLYVGHKEGISFYDEQKKEWKHFKNKTGENPFHVRNPSIDSKGRVWFYDNRIAGHIDEKGKMSLLEHPVLYENLPGSFLMTPYENEVFMFSFVNGKVYTFDSREIKEYSHPELHELLKNRKLTCARKLSDGNFWIGTFNGVIRFNPKDRSVKLFYPKLAVSDCIMDRAGNYWFSTLQNGIIRVPDLDNIIWNTANAALSKEKIHKLALKDSLLYFASADGLVAGINTNTLGISTYESDIVADIQCLSIVDSKLYYLIQNSLYELLNQKPKLLGNDFYPMKVLLKAGEDYVYGTAIGSYVVDRISKPSKKYMIGDARVRDGISDEDADRFWLATNIGLMSFEKNAEGIWSAKDTFFKGIQISAADADYNSKTVYALDFDGNIQSVSGNVSSTISRLPNNIQGFQLDYDQGRIYVATQKGLWIYNLQQKVWKNYGRIQGLASNNLRDVAVSGNQIWLAGTKGLQLISLKKDSDVRARVFLPDLRDASGKKLNPENLLNLKYREAIVLKPEAVSYQSEGNFRFAYRIRTNGDEWYYFPSNIEEIRVAGLRPGTFELELKVTDHEGRDSENIIIIKGLVQTPFWQKWWFFLLLAAAASGVIFLTVRYQIGRLRAKQAKEIQRLQLESELRITRETALKAQMNPHFLFNVLNSIKGYIYENDKKSAVAYLNRFSELIRKVLELSAAPKVKLSSELDLLKAYIDLEAMLMHQDFSYSVRVDDSIDEDFTEIPALLLQPYVENAFKHGLRHKTGAKRLEIHILPDGDDYISIEISDNGIGRQASADINKKSATGHQSFATSATQKRIQLLNQETASAVSVLFEDLKDEHGNACGTKVKLKIYVNG